jgi:hypothetical protein
VRPLCLRSGLVLGIGDSKTSHAIAARGIGVRGANASGALTGVRPLCLRSGLVLGIGDSNTSHAIGARGIGVRGANASGTLTGARSLCSRWRACIANRRLLRDLLRPTRTCYGLQELQELLHESVLGEMNPDALDLHVRQRALHVSERFELLVL